METERTVSYPKLDFHRWKTKQIFSAEYNPKLDIMHCKICQGAATYYFLADKKNATKHKPQSKP